MRQMKQTQDKEQATTDTSTSNVAQELVYIIQTLETKNRRLRNLVTDQHDDIIKIEKDVMQIIAQTQDLNNRLLARRQEDIKNNSTLNQTYSKQIIAQRVFLQDELKDLQDALYNVF